MVLKRNGPPVFPLGSYELPRTDDEAKMFREAGVSLLRCKNRETLDEAYRWGMDGWVRVPMILEAGDDGSALMEKITTLRDHPALVVWEGPDEAIWHRWRVLVKDGQRFWRMPPDLVAEVQANLDALVAGMARGVALIREHDPAGRPTWLNEATGIDQDTLVRCLPSLDIVGFDCYPVPHGEDKPLHRLGLYVERFRRNAPAKELWIVEQAFSWSSLKETAGQNRPLAYPTREEFRFMAWQAILRGATALLWWGSQHEDRPAPFMDDWMTVVRELSDLQPFLVVGNRGGILARTDHRLAPPALGVSCCVRQAEGRAMLALVNEDAWAHDVIVSGLDETVWSGFSPAAEPSEPFVATPQGYVATMQGYETRIYVTR